MPGQFLNCDAIYFPTPILDGTLIYHTPPWRYTSRVPGEPSGMPAEMPKILILSVDERVQSSFTETLLDEALHEVLVFSFDTLNQLGGSIRRSPDGVTYRWIFMPI